MNGVRNVSTRWKVIGAVALFLLVGWVLAVGLGHGGGSTGTTTINLHTTP
jgi:hypothetical protein